jgi:phospholipid/cholesterol/gamma-HCH transport system substrate-binding protein
VRERVRNVMVGLCTIGALGGGAALLFLFGEIEPFMAKRWPMKVAFNEAGGLRKGSLVTLNGVPIGAVERVEFWGDREHPVLVTAAIDEDVLIPDPSVPSVQASLLGSGARLEFAAALPLASPATHYAKSAATPLRGRVQSLEARIVSELEERVAPIAAAFDEIGALARNLNTLVAPDSGGAELNPESLRTAVRRLNATLSEAETAIASARTWLDDEQLRTDIRDTANGASELMRDATITANRIGTLADSLATDARELRANAIPVLARAEASLEEFNRLLLAVRTGDGTTGRLINDPALYDGLADSARRLDEALAKLNLLIDKIRAEGIDVELFPK